MSREGSLPVREEWSAGGIVLRRLRGEAHVLLILDPYGHWGLPKGHIEPGEDPDEAALREVREETGLDDLRLGPEVGVIEWRFHRRGFTVHKHCRFFLMGAPHGQPTPQLEEGIRDCRWLPLDEAIGGLGYDNTRDVLRRAEEMLVEEQVAPPWLAGGGSARR